MSDLAARLDAALQDNDAPLLVQLYTEAAAQSQAPRQRAFLLTHAYVHALECGHAGTERLKQELIAIGAEPPNQSMSTET
ncbi:hypothetical protein [Primorskyibacter sp. S187A]|uniref:hypothetical protein n=1 Tax=Primorskyibacter sp. S187A TaxID=3415130 RepID=UPI003C7DC3C0